MEFMKQKLLLLFFILLVSGIAFVRWNSCWIFGSNFYFTTQTLSTMLVTATNADSGVPLFIVRAMHNKLSGFVWGVLQTQLQYWDIRFLVEFLGIVGGIGVYLGLWYFLTRQFKNKFLWVIFILTMSASFVEMFFIPHIGYKLRIIPLFLLFESIALFGYWQFLLGNKRWRYYLGIGLLILSLLAVAVFPHSHQAFCIKI